MGEDGNLKSTYQVLKEISAEWDNMTSSERQALGISLAGKTQFEVFTSVLNNFADAERALTIAKKAQGSAWKENARYMDSIEAKYQALRTSVENLVLGDGGLEKLVKNILDVTTSIVKFIDNAGGLNVIIGILTSTIILLSREGIAKLITGLFAVKASAIQATETITLFGGAVTTTNTALTASAGVVGLLALALTGLVVTINAYNNSNDIAIDKIEKLNQKIASEQNEIDEINKKIEEATNRLKELNDVNPELVNQKEIDNLNFTILQLERELAIKKEIAKQDEDDRRKQAGKVVFGTNNLEGIGAFNTRIENIEQSKLASALGYEGGYKSLEGTQYDISGKQNYQVLKIYTDRIAKITEERKALQELQSQYAQGTEEYDKYQQKINETVEVEGKQRQLASELYTQLKDATENLSETSTEYLIAKDSIDYYADGLLNVQTVEEKQQTQFELIDGLLKNTAEQYGLTAEQQNELADMIDEATANLSEEDNAYEVAIETRNRYIAQLEAEQEETENSISAIKRINDAIDDIQSSYSTLSSAVEEYNSAEGLTIDTLQSLLSLSPEYLSMLDFENGKLVLNEEALINKTNALMNEAKATVYSEAVERIKARMDEALNKTSRNASDGLDVETEALNRNSEALAENNRQLYQKLVFEAQDKNVDISDIVKDVENQIKAIDSVVKGVNLNFSKTMTSAKDKTDKANKSLDKTNNKLKTTNERLEKLKETIKEIQDDVSEDEKVISYINGKLDEEIERLENLRDAEVEAIEDQIDALDKLQEEQEKQAKERIQLLEEEKNTLIDNNKLQINELEKRQNAEEEYWNNKIQALKDQNQALQDQADLEKLLENLEKAKNTKVRVYKEGQGFVWDTDQTAVTKAQKEIEAYNRKKAYEDQLKELENFKKSALKNYEEQINDLKTLNDNIKNQYDKQINTINNELEIKKKAYEEEKKILQDRIDTIKSNYQTQIDYFKNFKEQFNKQVNAYNDEQLRLLALEKTGIDFENENWKTRLDNLDNFVKNYNNKLAELSQKQKELAELEKQLKDANNAINNISVPSTPSSPSSPSDDPSTPSPKGTKKVYTAGGNEFNTRGEAETWIRNKQNEAKRKNADIDAQIAKISDPHVRSQLQAQKVTPPSYTIGEKIIPTYATGISTIKDNQFAIVGDDPRNRELVVGAKLNGMAMQLKKGTGVVNAKSTNTVAGLLNGLGSELGKASTGNYNLSNMNTNNNNQSIHIGTISLPQVRDSDDFITALKNFENLMAQRAYASI